MTATVAKKMGKGRTKKKGIIAYTKEGFEAVRALDNGNIYGVMFSEMISNIFKEGMWFKALTPYMLILTNNDPIQVGNMLTLNGVTRAFVGVASGRLLINNYGVEAIWIVTGFVGILSLLINVVCLSQSSVGAAYFLNFAWAIYNGLWNSCLETSWSRSIIRSYREDVNGARQITNKVTTALGPLFSAAIFIYYGNTWDIALVQRVMLIGTVWTLPVVLLTFCFRVSEEIVQEIKLKDINRIVFRDPSSPDQQKVFKPKNLTFNDFHQDPAGFVQLTYPIAHDEENAHWASRIKIMTSDFKDTHFMLVKQFHVSFNDMPSSERTCLLVFENDSRPAIRVDLTSVHLFLSEPEYPEDPLPVNCAMSELICTSNPCLSRAPKRFRPLHIVSKLVLGNAPGEVEANRSSEGLREALLPDVASADAADEDDGGPKEVKFKGEPVPNILGANIIVVCDVLNALGAGFSLKFMDLFLKVEYGVSPAGVFMVAFLQNMFAAWFTPYAKVLLNEMRRKGFRAKLGVVMLWAMALFFLGLLCIPGMPLWVVAPSIVMMQSLNSCTRAYNRAALVNYLPREKIATYMGWDALNKANQGGIAIFGAQVVAIGGYRGCFFGTFIIFTIRMFIYLAFTLRKGSLMRGSSLLRTRSAIMSHARSEEDIDFEDMNANENIKASGVDEEDSQLFLPSEALASPSTQRYPHVVAVDMDGAFTGQGTPARTVAADVSVLVPPAHGHTGSS